MAITMKSSTSQTRNTSSVTTTSISNPGLCRTVDVVINNDGTVNLNKPLNLGYKGDNKATYIRVNLDNLNFGSLTQAAIENQYIPYLNFQSANGFHKSYPSEEANLFFIDSEITNQVDNQAVTFLISFALVERTDDNTSGNVEGENADQYKEIFVSQTFTGVVMPNGLTTGEEDFELIDSEEAPLVITSQTPVALHKPAIQLTWDGVKLIPSTSVIGFVGDRLITPIHLQNFPKENNGNNGLITVFFSNKNYKCKAEFEDIRDLKFWLPYEITSYAIGNEEQIVINNEKENSWYIALKIISGDAIAYTPFTEVKVLASLEFGEEADIQEIYTTLYDDNNAVILDSNGDVIEVPDIMGATAQINYSAGEIEIAIGWVYDNQNDIAAHLENTNIHITKSERDTINSLDGRLTTVEEAVNSFDKNIQSQVEKHTEQIASLNQSVSSLAAADNEINRELIQHDGHISSLSVALDSTNNRLIAAEEDIDDIEANLRNINSNFSTEIAKEALKREQEDVQLASTIESTKTALETKISTDISSETSAREQADNTLQQGITALTSKINQVESAIPTNTIQHDSGINGFVAKIIFLSSEAEYQTLVDEGKIEANTLYLIQEEEE